MTKTFHIGQLAIFGGNTYRVTVTNVHWLNKLQAQREAIKGFHWQNDIYFIRQNDGSVKVMQIVDWNYTPNFTEWVIPPMHWASIVCSVSAEGETTDRWNAAQDFHGRAAKAADFDLNLTDEQIELLKEATTALAEAARLRALLEQVNHTVTLHGHVDRDTPLHQRIVAATALKVTEQRAGTKHPSHETRSSDASTFDEVCIKCGAKDIAGGGWGKLAEPCLATASKVTG